MEINILTAVAEWSVLGWERIWRGKVSISDGGGLNGGFGLDMDSYFWIWFIFPIIV